MPCCCFTLRQGEQAVVTTFTSKRLVEGPAFINFFIPCCESVAMSPMVNLDAQEMLQVSHLRHPEKTELRFGPQLVKLHDAWERLDARRRCEVLDQDDYLIVRSPEGVKDVVRGPCVYRPRHYAEVIESKAQSIQVPVNNYIIVADADSTSDPITHVRGPVKWYPKPFQSVVRNLEKKLDYWPCWEITAQQAVHVQRRTGAVELLQDPQFYMPQVGEQLIRTVRKQVLVPNDFCILKSPNGAVTLKDGQKPADRSFFPGPFEEFLMFNVDKPRTVITTLPTFMAHKFNVRTLDNVLISLDVRVSYKFEDVRVFCSNPIDFYDYIKNHVQNNLLDKFAQSTLRDFMNSFGAIAVSTIGPTNEYFRNFGIVVDDVQILNFACTNAQTNELLKADNHMRVTKENELKARQSDILIQEQANEVKRKEKDLDVQMSMKDNEVCLRQKLLENGIRMKEMEIEIQEEKKRTVLLEVRRRNDLVEAEFEGRAKGHALREFLAGIDPKLTAKQKVEVYFKQVDLMKAQALYSKANKMTIYPKATDIKQFQMPTAAAAQAMQDAYIQGIGFTHGKNTQSQG